MLKILRYGRTKLESEGSNDLVGGMGTKGTGGQPGNALHKVDPLLRIYGNYPDSKSCVSDSKLHR